MNPETSLTRRLPQDLWERLSPREREILVERLALQERQADHLRKHLADETEPVVTFTLEGQA